MLRRVELKTAIVEKFWSQSDFARATNLQESRVSKILNGRIDPSPEEKRRLPAALGEDIIQRVFKGE